MNKSKNKRILLNKIYEELFFPSPIENRKLASLIMNEEDHHLHSLFRNPDYQYIRPFTDAVKEKAELLIFAYNMGKEQKDQLALEDIMELLEDYKDRKEAENEH